MNLLFSQNYRIILGPFNSVCIQIADNGNGGNNNSNNNILHIAVTVNNATMLERDDFNGNGELCYDYAAPQLQTQCVQIAPKRVWMAMDGISDTQFASSLRNFLSFLAEQGRHKSAILSDILHTSSVVSKLWTGTGHRLCVHWDWEVAAAAAAGDEEELTKDWMKKEANNDRVCMQSQKNTYFIKKILLNA